MQGKYTNILKCCEVPNAFKEMLHPWCRRVKRGNLSNYSTLEEVNDKDESLISSVREETMNHSEILSR